jgi:hypothetical protein
MTTPIQEIANIHAIITPYASGASTISMATNAAITPQVTGLEKIINDNTHTAANRLAARLIIIEAHHILTDIAFKTGDTEAALTHTKKAIDHIGKLSPSRADNRAAIIEINKHISAPFCFYTTINSAYEQYIRALHDGINHKIKSIDITKPTAYAKPRSTALTCALSTMDDIVQKTHLALTYIRAIHTEMPSIPASQFITPMDHDGCINKRTAAYTANTGAFSFHPLFSRLNEKVAIIVAESITPKLNEAQRQLTTLSQLFRELQAVTTPDKAHSNIIFRLSNIILAPKNTTRQAALQAFLTKNDANAQSALLDDFIAVNDLDPSDKTKFNDAFVKMKSWFDNKTTDRRKAVIQALHGITLGKAWTPVLTLLSNAFLSCIDHNVRLRVDIRGGATGAYATRLYSPRISPAHSRQAAPLRAASSSASARGKRRRGADSLTGPGTPRPSFFNGTGAHLGGSRQRTEHRVGSATRDKFSTSCQAFFRQRGISLQRDEKITYRPNRDAPLIHCYVESPSGQTPIATFNTATDVLTIHFSALSASASASASSGSGSESATPPAMR